MSTYGVATRQDPSAMSGEVCRLGRPCAFVIIATPFVRSAFLQILKRLCG